MSRWEFIRRLEELLVDIPPAEREEALQYYNDYINDGGKENEQEILASLGTPERVAATIKAGLEGTGGEFTEKGFHNATDDSANPITKYQQPAPEANAQNFEPQKKGLSGGILALVIIACVIFSPGILGLAVGILSVIFTGFLTLLILLVTFAAVAIATIAASIIFAVVGISNLFYSPLIGMSMIAAAFILAGVGILFLLMTTVFIGRVIPGAAKGISYLFRRIFNGRGGK